jgi:hypothetical protein
LARCWRARKPFYRSGSHIRRVDGVPARGILQKLSCPPQDLDIDFAAAAWLRRKCGDPAKKPKPEADSKCRSSANPIQAILQKSAISFYVFLLARPWRNIHAILALLGKNSG